MKHFGDITNLSGYTLPIVDVITGGSPCQDLSVAGKRAGLAGERSGLFMEQMRIVKEMRERDRANGRTGWMVRPRYMVWENVPGAFSSGNPKGADFAAVIEEIIKVAEPGTSVSVCVPNGGWTKSGCYYAEDGSWSIAWRVHDAQFWGVPQRRKRIALVADFGGLSASEILFERKGLSGDSEPCGEAGQETAGAAGGGSKSASGVVSKGNGEAFLMREKTSSIAAGGGMPGQGYPCVMEINEAAGGGVEGASPCYGLDHVMLSGGTTYQGRGYYDDVSGCLKTQPHGVCETISFQERAGKPGGGKGILIQHEHVGALSTLNNQSVLSFDPSMSRYAGTVFKDVAKTLTPGTSPGHHDAICTKEPILLESNQNHATVQTDGISTALPASMGMGGGYVPMVVEGASVGVDVYNQEITGEVAASLTAACGGTNTSGAKVLAFKQGQGSKAGSIGAQAECAPTLSAVASGTNQVPAVMAFAQNQIGEVRAGTVSGTLNTNSNATGRNSPLVYDARGNGDGETVCTITGDHKNRVTDYTALCVGNGQLNQMSMAEQANAPDTMHDQQAVLCGNPWDPQSERVFHGDGAWHSLAGNSGGGQSRDAVLQYAPDTAHALHAKANCQFREDSKTYVACGNPWDPQSEKVYVGDGAWHTLYAGEKGGQQRDAVMVAAVDCRNLNENGAISGTLQSKENGGYSLNYTNPVRTNAIVRRLTPLECERLQGYPDGWTLIGEPEEVEVKDYETTYDEDGNEVGKRLVGTHKEIEYFYIDEKGKRKRCADSARYKALGNSVALPFWQWMARRICAQYERNITMGSLFDGIGGFPLVFERCGAKAVWASEIEEFPIAVTKRRFPEVEV